MSSFASNALSDTDYAVLKSCQICGRTFNPKSLERHEKICEKSKKLNRRTVFNSFLQRAKEIGTAPLVVDVKNKDKSKTKGRWKEEHENLLHVMKGGKTLNGNNDLCSRKIMPPGYQQCPTCDRHFSEKAADRHISWCREQSVRLPKTPPSTEALEKLKARVTYRAPLPRTKILSIENPRLVRSADSIRESSLLRTHSSPLLSLTKRSSEPSAMRKNKRTETRLPVCEMNNNLSVPSKVCDQEFKVKKAVKFKELFPVNNKEKNRNLDMLAALRLRLSELSTSDDFFENYISTSDTTRVPRGSYSNIPSTTVTGAWTSEGEVHFNNNDTSTPTLSSERHLARFCYNCGTKYPIMSAKYCCECGAQRFLVNTSDQELSVP